MIKINFQEPNTDNWRAWRTQCENEQRMHNEAFAAGQKPKVKDDVYKGKKYNIKSDVYMNLDGPFHGKCVYCESYMASDQDGDMEHFRPKNAVSKMNFEPVKVEINGEIKDHPGYYWLCYDYKNLLPSCILCNQKRKHGEKFIGKHTRFPVDGDYAVRPGEEVNEYPLLLNPVFDYPEQHLELQETGIFKALTDEGEACIHIFGLNKREALVESRKIFYNSVKNDLDMFIIHSAKCSNEVKERLERLGKIKDIWDGKGAYSAAGLLAIDERAPVLRTIFELQDSA